MFAQQMPMSMNFPPQQMQMQMPQMQMPQMQMPQLARQQMPRQQVPGGYPAGQGMMAQQPPPPARWPTTHGQPVPARPAPMAQVQAPPPSPQPAATLRPPVVRGVSAEVTAFSMPSPESLHIDATSRVSAGVDWTSVRGQLARLRATGFQLETLPEGGCRFACQVPDSNNQLRRLEGRGRDEAQAIQACLAQANR